MAQALHLRALRERDAAARNACAGPSRRVSLSAGTADGVRPRGLDQPRVGSMSDTFDAEAFVAAAAPALGLDLDAAHRPGVVANMARIAGLAQLVVEFPLAEADEPAPVFTP